MSLLHWHCDNGMNALESKKIRSFVLKIICSLSILWKQTLSGDDRKCRIADPYVTHNYSRLQQTSDGQWQKHGIHSCMKRLIYCHFPSDVCCYMSVQYIPRNMHTVFALLCFVVVIHGLIFPYPSGLLHWHCGNLTIAPVPARQPWWIWINTSCEFIMNDCITTTKQSTTKPCAHFLRYTVYQQKEVSIYKPNSDNVQSIQPCLFILGKHKKCICFNYHFAAWKWNSFFNIPHVDKEPFTMHRWYHGWPSLPAILRYQHRKS